MYQIRTRHLPVAMATKTVQNGQSTTGTKEMKIHVRFNEKSLKTQKSVYLKIVCKYSRSNQLEKLESYQVGNQKICIQAKQQKEEKKKRWSEFRIEGGHRHIEGGNNRNDVPKNQNDTKDPKQIRVRQFGL